MTHVLTLSLRSADRNLCKEPSWAAIALTRSPGKTLSTGKGIGVADRISMEVEHTVSTAQAVGNRADDLRAELDRLARDWQQLSSTWTGVAASAYTPPWREWHEAATVLMHSLREMSELLVQNAISMNDRDDTSARMLGSVTGNGLAP